MIASEALTVFQLVQRRWGNAELDLKQFSVDILELDVDVRTACAAVDAIHASGAEFPPTAGAIARQVAMLQVDPPQWAEVKRQMNLRRSEIAAARLRRLRWSCPHQECDGGGFVEVGDAMRRCRCHAARLASRDGASTLSPIVQEFLDRGYVTLGEVDDVADPDQRDRSTLEAQMREKWKAFAAEVVDFRVLSLMGTSADVARLERARAEDAARRRGGRGLARPSMLKHLERGED